jgi:hypothetical protein
MTLPIVTADDPSIVRILPPNYADYEPGDWIWDGDTPVENVAAAQQRFWDEVKQQRTAMLAEPCETPSGWVQTDDASLAAIDRLLSAARLDPDGWSDVFTMADNSDEPRWRRSRPRSRRARPVCAVRRATCATSSTTKR